MKRIIGIAVLLVLLVGGYIFGKPYYDLHFGEISLTKSEQIVYIPTGSTLADIATIMNSKDIISTENFESYAAQLDFTDEKVEPGKYKVTDGMKVKNLIYGLKNGNQEIQDVRITFNNCQNIYDMAGKVAPNIEADSAEIVAYILHPSTMENYGFREETIAALFLPDTYEVGEWDMTAEEFVVRMAEEYKSFWTDERLAKAKALSLQQSEIATVASIVEAEQGRKPEEWSTIAGLYLNRVRLGMRLQSDPTAKFCWGNELEGVQRLLNVHMEKDCPYNTYIYAGLPPGPIRMPSKKAMDAVLNAEDHDYLYMCAKPGDENGTDGLHNFAESYSQHLANARKFQAYMSKMGY